MSLARIALVKGGDNSLPPLTRDDCLLSLRANFLPYYPCSQSQATQLIGWFDPVDGTPQCVEQVDQVNRKELPLWEKTAHSMTVALLQGSLQVCFVCCRATAVPPLFVPTSAQRTLHVALAGEGNGVWHDGYLVHFSAAGQVLSLHTAPGTARLFVPEVPRTQQGIEPDVVALPAEGHYLKLCLRAQLTSRYGELASGKEQRKLESGKEQQELESGKEQRKFTLVIDDTSLRAMVCVVLFSAMYEVAVAAAADELPPAWRRLLQNLGLPCIRGKGALLISELTQLVPNEKATLSMAQDINSQAAVIPAKMLGKS